jgi:hypothetical protein
MLFSRLEALELYEASKLTYSNINKGEFELLVEMIRKELTHFTSIRMTISPKTTAKYCADGICYGTIYVDANYFEGREAITFERNGFINFGHWASDDTVQPFLDAFEHWVNKLTGIDKNGALNFLNLAHKMGYDFMKLDGQKIILSRNRDSKSIEFHNTVKLDLEPLRIYEIPEMYKTLLENVL